MKYTYCKGCGQRVRSGKHKPDEFQHAPDCPVKAERDKHAEKRRLRDREFMRKRAERLGHPQ